MASLRQTQDEYDLLKEKLYYFRQDFVIETDTAVKFKLRKQIEVAETQVKAIEARLDRKARLTLTCPYRGLSVFREQDEADFFGREACTAKILEAMQRAPLTAILGASGSGKSSLIYAGVIPALRRGECSSAAGNWLVMTFRPGEQPCQALAEALLPVLEPDLREVDRLVDLKKLRDTLQSGQLTLDDVLRRIQRKHQEAPILLFIDQFEELYALCDDAEERRRFIEQLLGINPPAQNASRLKSACSDNSSGVHIILTLRSDFLGHTNSHPNLSHAIAANEVVVPAMNEAELRQAIAEPARRAGQPLNAEVVDLLIEQSAGREGALPLLEFALMRIWEGMARDLEPAETLRQIGGVGGALANRATDVFKDLSASEQQIARRAFLAMIRLGEGSRDTRRRVALADIVGHRETPEQVHEILRHFTQPGARLITLADDHSEITHEALLDHWQTLQEWLDASRDDLRFQRRLAEAAHHWAQQDRAEGLLWRSPDLDVLRQFQQRAGEDLTPLQVEFFEAAQQKARHARRIRRMAVSAIVALAVLMSLAAGVAFWAYKDARYQSRVSLVRSLVAYALQDDAQKQRERAALLARQAFLLNQRFNGGVDAQIEEALRTIFRTASIMEEPGSPVLAEQVCQKVTLKTALTPAEWQQFIGDEVEYAPACPELLNAIQLQLRSGRMITDDMEALSLNLQRGDCMYLGGWGIPDNFIKNEFEEQGGVILDRATGLLWQQSGSQEALTYSQAQEYVAQLNRAKLAGYADWRLPTIEELLSLVEEETRMDRLYIDPLFERLNSEGPEWIWSADVKQMKGVKLSPAAWFVPFKVGGVDQDSIEGSHYVRAVRSWQGPR